MKDYLSEKNLELTKVEWVKQEQTQKMYAQLSKEAQDSLSTIESLLAPTDLANQLERSPSSWELRSPPKSQKIWVWVQSRRQNSLEWQDLDSIYPNFVHPEPDEAIANFSETNLYISLQALTHDGRMHTLVDWQGPANVALGSTIQFSVLPAGTNLSKLKQIDDAKKVQLWNPLLQVGPNMITGSSFTPDGTFYSSTDNTIKAGMGTLFDLNNLAQEGFNSVPIQSMSVAHVDASAYPRIHLQLNIEPLKQPAWHPAHFRLYQATQQVPIRLETLAVSPRPLIIMLDISNSMSEFNRIEEAKKALHVILQGLPDNQQIAFMTFAKEPKTIVELVRLGDNRTRLTDAINKIYLEGSTYIPEAVNYAVSYLVQPAYILFLTDGTDSRKLDGSFYEVPEDYATAFSQSLALLNASQHVFISIGMGESDDHDLMELATQSKGYYYFASQSQDLTNIFQSLGKELSGQVTISFVDPEAGTSQPGDTKNIRMELEGYTGTLDAHYQIPITPQSKNIAGLRLVIRWQETGEDPVQVTRLLHTMVAQLIPGNYLQPIISQSYQRHFRLEPSH